MLGLDQNTKCANIGPPSKRHLNCISLAGLWWNKIEPDLYALWFFRGIYCILLVGSIPTVPLWIRACLSRLCNAWPTIDIPTCTVYLRWGETKALGCTCAEAHRKIDCKWVSSQITEQAGSKISGCLYFKLHVWRFVIMPVTQFAVNVIYPWSVLSSATPNILLRVKRFGSRPGSTCCWS